MDRSGKKYGRIYTKRIMVDGVPGWLGQWSVQLLISEVVVSSPTLGAETT